MHKRLFTATGLVLAVVMLFAVNVVSNAAFRSARLDLTQNKLYTLSEGTRHILEKLEEPITLRYYVSQKLATLLPGIHIYVMRVGELLEEFEQAAGGKIAFQAIDPEPFSDEEDRAVGYGLKGAPVAEGEALFYFGLVGTSSTDDEAIIAFFQPEREQFLEYDIAKLVYQLAHPNQKVIGLITSLPLDGIPTSPIAQQPARNEPWILYDQMLQSFEVRKLTTDVTSLPDDIDVLMLVHPKNLSTATLYAIDQFVVKGGRALVFVDPHSEADRTGVSPFNPMARAMPRNSDLPKLFDAWGLQLVAGKVVGDLPFARRVQYRHQQRILSADYPVWIDLPPSQFNREEIVTAELPNITMATPGALEKKEAAETEFIALVQTGDTAMLIDVSRVQFASDIAVLVQDYVPGGESLTLAVRITGNIKSAFADGPPRGFEAATDAGAVGHAGESADPINVIVVADTDLLQDYFWVQVQSFLGQRVGVPTAGNGSFVINALDNLSGSNDLISVRNRGGFKRPFTLVRAIQQDAERRFLRKEQELLERKRSTERKIQELQTQRQDTSALILSTEQEQEVERFRLELVEIRKDLRGVQHELQKNIEHLEAWLKFLNIGLMPLIIGLLGLLASLKQMRRKRPDHRTAQSA